MDGITKNKIAHLFKSSLASKLAALAAIVIVLGVGYLVLRTGATSYYAGVSVNDGSLSGNATLVNDSGANDGVAVKFGPQPSTPPSEPEPEPEPDPTPPGGSSSGACPPFPAFPDENCTGVPAGTSLHTSGCPKDLKTPNAVYDGCLFENGVVVFENATNVTIKNSKIYYSVRPLFGSQTAHPGSLRNLTLINVEVDGRGQWNNNGAGISGSDYTCIRCTIYGTGRGFNLNDNVRIEDSYIPGDFVYQSGDHKTAIGSNGGSNYEIIHNNFVCDSDQGAGCSSALSLYGDFAPINNALVKNNLFNVGSGTGSYCVYAGSVSGKPHPLATNTRFIDNRFGKMGNPNCGIFGPVTSWNGAGAGNVWSGNAWADGSGPVNP